MAMNGAWNKPEWLAASAALQQLENKSKSSGNGDKSPVKSTSTTTALTTTMHSTPSYDASFYSPYYASFPYPCYPMYGYSPYNPCAYMSFAGPALQQMQPPPPPPPSAKTEPKSESSSDHSQSANTVSVSASATSCNSISSAEAKKEPIASTASITQPGTCPASSGDNASAGYSYSGSSWQPSGGMNTSSAAGMWSQFPNMGMSSPRPKFSAAVGFQRAAPVGGGSWQQSVRPSQSSASSAMPSIHWSNPRRTNPYEGTFRQTAPKQSPEPYCPFDPTESEEYEDHPANSESFGGYTPAPGVGNLRFRMPNRGACRPMQWRQQSPRPCFSPEMQSPHPQRGPVQRSPDWRFGQRSLRPDQGNVGSRPVIMPRLKNYSHRARSPWDASPDVQKMQSSAIKPHVLQESRWDKDATLSSTADADKSTAGPSSEPGAANSASCDEWPAPLKDYVHRCFSSVKDDRDKDVMEAKLKMMLTAAFSDGTALTRDWDHEPVPDVLNRSPSFQSLSSPLASDGRGRLPSNLRSPRNFKFAGSVHRGRRGTPTSSGRRGQGWSPPGFRRRSRSQSHSRKSRSRSSSHSSSSSRHSSRSRRRRHRRRRNSR